MKSFLAKLMLVSTLLTIACASQNCREMKDGKSQQPAQATNPPTSATTANPAGPVGPQVRVKVFKYDGSKQCGMAESVPLDKMQTELKNIQVFSAANLADGLMHIQACGTATGKANVYEIDRKDLSDAKKFGFKEWIY